MHIVARRKVNTAKRAAIRRYNSFSSILDSSCITPKQFWHLSKLGFRKSFNNPIAHTRFSVVFCDSMHSVHDLRNDKRGTFYSDHLNRTHPQAQIQSVHGDYMLKSAAVKIFMSLCYIFNPYITSWLFPSSWISANVSQFTSSVQFMCFQSARKDSFQEAL